jgi:hypothetical protein
MKLKFKDEETKVFKPVKIELTVESIEELRLLFHAFNRRGLRNAIFNKIGVNYGTTVYYDEDLIAGDFEGDLWVEIQNKIKELGYEL